MSRTLRRYAKVFQNLDNHIAQRAHDIYDIEKSLLRNLLGQRRETLASISEPVVILAHNLTPSETANLDRRFVKGFATELGGPGSHTAIVADNFRNLTSAISADGNCFFIIFFVENTKSSSTATFDRKRPFVSSASFASAN